MVASKTSFIVAAVALSAASSVYAVPAPFDAGSDLATRGFEDDEFQLAARFFDDDVEFEARTYDDELEARDLEDEDLYARSYFEDEDELFARATDTKESMGDRDGSATDPIRVKTPHRTDRHPHHHRKHDRKPPHLELETGYRGPGRHGPNRYGEGKENNLVNDYYQRPSRIPSLPGQIVRNARTKGASVGNTQKRSIESSAVKAGLRGFKISNSKGHNSRPRRPHHRHRKHSNWNNHLNVHVDVPNTSDTSASPQDVTTRDVNDMVILARSLGLDDDYFLEERSFEDDMYEY